MTMYSVFLVHFHWNQMFASDLDTSNFRNSKNFFQKYFLKTVEMEDLTMEVRQMMSKVVCGSTNWQKMCRVRCQCYVGWRCLVEKLQSSQQPTTVPLNNRSTALDCFWWVEVLSVSLLWIQLSNGSSSSNSFFLQLLFWCQLLRLRPKKSGKTRECSPNPPPPREIKNFFLDASDNFHFPHYD